MKKLFIIFTMLMSLCSCDKKEIARIELKDVFLVKEEKYIVLFYSSSCHACLDSLDILNKRYQIRKYPGFCVEISGLNGVLNKEKRSNIGVASVDDLSLVTVPYLVFIKQGIIQKELYGVKEIQKENLYIFFE